MRAARNANGTSASGTIEKAERIGIEPPRRPGTRLRSDDGEKADGRAEKEVADLLLGQEICRPRARAGGAVRWPRGRRRRSRRSAARSSAAIAAAASRSGAPGSRRTQVAERRAAAGRSAALRRIEGPRRGNVRTSRRRRAGKSARATSSSRTDARSRPSTGGTGVRARTRPIERANAAKRREAPALGDAAVKSGARARDQERDADSEEEEVADSPRAPGRRVRNDRSASPRRSVTSAGRPREPARRIARGGASPPSTRSSRSPGFQAGRPGRGADGPDAESLGFARNEDVGPTECRNLTRQEKRQRDEARENSSARSRPARDRPGRAGDTSVGERNQRCQVSESLDDQNCCERMACRQKSTAEKAALRLFGDRSGFLKRPTQNETANPPARRRLFFSSSSPSRRLPSSRENKRAQVGADRARTTRNGKRLPEREIDRLDVVVRNGWSPRRSDCDTKR